MKVFGFMTVFLLTIVHGLRLPLEGLLEIEHDSDVSFSNNEVNLNSRNRREVTSLPESTIIVVRIKGDNHSIPITRSRQADVNLPIYVQNDGVMYRKSIEPCRTCGLYQSRSHQGSFLLHDLDENDQYKIFGSFYLKSHQYVIQPMASTEGEVKGQGRSQGQEGHAVFRVPKQSTVFETIQPQVPRAFMQKWRENLPKANRSRRRRQAERLEIEVLLVTDYSVYQFWYDQSINSINRYSETLQSIRQYYSYVLNELDLRYENFGSDQYSIDVIAPGIIISDAASKSPWTEGRRQQTGDTVYVEANAVLDAFTSWLTTQSDLPPFDHAMSFTGYDIFVASGSETSDNTGIAFSGTMCRPQSTSLVEDNFNFVAMVTAAHELGHSLGAVHDGQGNECTSDNNFIMAAQNSILDDERGRNMWLFSSCTVRDIIRKFTEGTYNCLRTRESNSYVAEPASIMADVYRPDDTCVLRFGPGSYVCRSIQNYTSMCSAMYCNKPGTNQCFAILPAEKTSCGNNKWCEQGVCVTSPSAPSDVTDDCPIGDLPGVIEDIGLGCAALVANNSAECYRSYVSTVCCKSCEAVQKGVTGCEYGDYFPVQCQGIPRNGCYANEELCCETCGKVKDESLSGCEYGDRASGCLRTNCPFYDTDTLNKCCETCASLISTRPPTTQPTTAAPTTTIKTTKPPTTTRATTPPVTTTPVTTPPVTTTPVTTRADTTVKTTRTPISTTSALISTTQITNETFTTEPRTDEGTTVSVTVTSYTRPSSTFRPTTSIYSSSHTTSYVSTTSSSSLTTSLPNVSSSSSTKMSSTTPRPIVTTSSTSTSTKDQSSQTSSTQKPSPTTSLTSTLSTTDFQQSTSVSPDTKPSAPPTTTQTVTSPSVASSTSSQTSLPVNTTVSRYTVNVTNVHLTRSTTEPGQTDQQNIGPGNLLQGLSEFLLVGIATGAGAVLLIIVIVVVCCVVRRGKGGKRPMTSNGVSGPNSYDNMGFPSTISLAEGPPSHAPPRRIETVDGYMMPAAAPTSGPDNISVQYAAPNKPKSFMESIGFLPRQRTSVSSTSTLRSGNHLRPPNEPHKRQSKPVHYRRTTGDSNNVIHKDAISQNREDERNGKMRACVAEFKNNTDKGKDPYESIKEFHDHLQVTSESDRPRLPSYGEVIQSTAHGTDNRASSNQQQQPGCSTFERRPTLPANHPGPLHRGDQSDVNKRYSEQQQPTERIGNPANSRRVLSEEPIRQTSAQYVDMSEAPPPYRPRQGPRSTARENDFVEAENRQTHLTRNASFTTFGRSSVHGSIQKQMQLRQSFRAESQIPTITRNGPAAANVQHGQRMSNGFTGDDDSISNSYITPSECHFEEDEPASVYDTAYVQPSDLPPKPTPRTRQISKKRINDALNSSFKALRESRIDAVDSPEAAPDNKYFTFEDERQYDDADGIVDSVKSSTRPSENEPFQPLGLENIAMIHV